MGSFNFEYRDKIYLVFGEDAHYYIDLLVIYNTELNLSKKIRFMVDTGAYLTVINNFTANELEHTLWKSITTSIPLAGFAGSTTATLKEMPKIVIGDRTLIGAKVAIPHDDTKQNILGMNILEHFAFFMDTDNMYMYFVDNQNYKLPEELKCLDVLSIRN